ncbi:hypothetical protein G6F36_006765 [Rhizopus arrhizus]|nr:hypothetical protein G6F36_006765 [Rhizopus arrhizus]
MSKVFNFKNGFPTLTEWTKIFKSKASSSPRATLGNSITALNSAKALNIKNVQQKTAVEIYPGLGIWTNALKEIGFKRVLTLEQQPNYFQWMKQVSETSNGVIETIKKDGYDWDTYTFLKDPNYLGSLQNTDWSKVHPNIFFTGLIPKGRKGEQLLSQFICCVNNRMAMQTFGRVPMAFWIPDQLFTKFTAGPSDSNRCKMSVVAEACSTLKVIYTTKEGDIYPESVYHLVSIVPLEESKIKADWDVFEYVLKHLFVMRRQPLKSMVRTLGPGAEIILGRLSFDTSILIRDLSAEQLSEVAQKFDEWPLRPKVLFEDASVFLTKQQ